MKHAGITVISGCMFSGKSDELLRRLDIATHAEHTSIAFKPKRDTRTNNEIASRSGRNREAIPVKDAEEIQQHINTHDIVAVDEAHFFGESIVPIVRKLANNDHHVIIAGLDLDYRGDPFEGMATLLALATHAVKLMAVCKQCNEHNASRSQRLTDHTTRELIGDNEAYEARCFDCFDPPS